MMDNHIIVSRRHELLEEGRIGFLQRNRRIGVRRAERPKCECPAFIQKQMREKETYTDAKAMCVYLFQLISARGA